MSAVGGQKSRSALLQMPPPAGPPRTHAPNTHTHAAHTPGQQRQVLLLQPLPQGAHLGVQRVVQR